MADLSVLFQHVTFRYDEATQPLISDLSVHFPRDWTGIVGANGVGKSTVLKLASGILIPQEGRILISGAAIYCEQRTDEVPCQLDELIQALDGNAYRIRKQLGLRDDWFDHWSSLSHGERKRAQIAVAIWRNPEILALDEPTNHLDIEAQEMVFAALSNFRGVGLLVSHDRRLLDGLCHQCLFIDPPDAILRPGNYGEGLAQAEMNVVTIQRMRAEARHEFERLKSEANRRRAEAAKADRKRSKRGLERKDHDSRARINLARVTGKDAAAGKKLRQLEGRLSQARTKLDGIKVKGTSALGIWMPGARSQRNTLFDIPAGSFPLGPKRALEFPDLLMRPDDRIALTGPNGSGKSTLIRYIMRSVNLGEDRVTYIPQEIDLRASKAILARARGLSGEKLGQVLTIVSRLGSRPQRLLETTEPSPGEIRKVLLATGIANEPHLVVMDEPTNHLDLPSIECLEEALRDCPCGILLVSHDRRFLETLTRWQWHISEDAQERGKFTLKTR